ncbi:uncharacterized protein LOC106959568 isoform X3 [Poecilia latipinna]|uniref:uncharacterized protein LOC106959568 isoform X3 n=1 Tax=Poecilia latipinna TaxID=48699 RepID=UPI00072E5370|nr:PREDICTED: uncharacterized protein LOC106959568 isoform X3 [Poecilia latipinna]
MSTNQTAARPSVPVFWCIERKQIVSAMYLKLKGYCLGVPLLYTLSTINLSSLVRCELTAHSLQPTSRSAPHNVGSGVLTTRVPGDPSTRAARHLAYFSGPRRQNLEDDDRTTTRLPGPGSKRGIGAKMASSSSLAPRYKRSQTEGERPFTSHEVLDGSCSRGTIRRVVPGKFYVTGQLEANPRHGGYRSDSAATVQTQDSRASGASQHAGGSEESWRKLEPSVECGDDAMTLTVRRKRAAQLLLDHVNGSSTPLLHLPQQCGYSVQSSWKDLTLTAQYDACHVVREDDCYVLPLLWRGIPVKVSCPVSRLHLGGEGPSSLCCSPNGMTVKLRGPSAVENPHINVRGEWTPLGLLAEQCGYTVNRLAAETAVAMPFITCGITVKDGKNTLLLKLGEEIFMLACPNSAFGEVSAAHWPLADSPTDFTRKLPKPKLESLRHLAFMPPFYLAPPYYPHPTYHHSYSENKEQDTHSPPTPLSVAPMADFSSQLNSQDHYFLSLKDVQENFMTQKPLSSKEKLSSLGSLHKDQKQNQVAPLLDVSMNSFSPTALPVQVEAPHSHHPSHDFSSHYHYHHHPKIPAPGTPQGPGPGLPGSQTSSDSPNHQPPSEQLEGLKGGPTWISSPVDAQRTNKVTAVHSPYFTHRFPFYYYYPHVVKGDMKRLGLSHLDWTAKTNASSLSLNPETQSINPEPEKEKADVRPSSKPKLEDKDDKRSTSVSPAPERPDPIAVPPDKPVFPTAGFTYNADPYKYYYHPYYNYYLKYYAPEALRGVYNHLGRALSDSLSVQQPSHLRYQTSPPPSEPGYDISSRLTFPYYYYYHYYLPQLFRYYQQLHLPGGKDSDKDSTSLLSPNVDYSDLQRFSRASDGCHSSAFSPAYSNYIAWHRSGFKEKLGDYMRAAPPAPSSEDRKAPCRLQKLSSDPDVHVAPPDGCERMPGQTVVHQAEVHGLLSDRGFFPVRLMVGCGAPSGPGDIRPSAEPPPSAVTVVLRIATDASFSSFHPKARLPISLLQGDSVHVELSLLQPADPSLLLLLHSCLAYTLTPHVYWMLFYDRCSSQSVSQLLPSPDPRHIWRIKVSSFPSLPPAGYTYRAPGRPAASEDPEVYFLCHTELCSAVYGDCGVSCNNGPNTDVTG